MTSFVMDATSAPDAVKKFLSQLCDPWTTVFGNSPESKNDCHNFIRLVNMIALAIEGKLWGENIAIQLVFDGKSLHLIAPDPLTHLINWVARPRSRSFRLLDVVNGGPNLDGVPQTEKGTYILTITRKQTQQMPVMHLFFVGKNRLFAVLYSIRVDEAKSSEHQQ